MTPPPRNPARSGLRSATHLPCEPVCFPTAKDSFVPQSPQRSPRDGTSLTPSPPRSTFPRRPERATVRPAPASCRDTGPLPVSEARGEDSGGAVERRKTDADGPLSARSSPRRQRRRLVLASVPRHLAKGRAFTRRALQDWGWDRTEASEDTLLLVSELLTNASLHSDGCRELVLTANGTTLRIEVHDGTTALPVRHPAPLPGSPSGRGTYIVERLSDLWGTHTYGDGKAVWAEIETSRLG
ncbi:ATP-binding protein [Streptomyces sp. NPDC059496]|uniref:ATP-binding protein n=1 Tax=Streptomyces sp. NPDC059496 TaxID=3346851 RepID=UPI0036C198C9